MANKMSWKECVDQGIITETQVDEDDKLILTKNISFSDEEIRKLTEFQEKFFESKIIRKRG